MQRSEMLISEMFGVDQQSLNAKVVRKVLKKGVWDCWEMAPTFFNADSDEARFCLLYFHRQKYLLQRSLRMKTKSIISGLCSKDNPKTGSSMQGTEQCLP